MSGIKDNIRKDTRKGNPYLKGVGNCIARRLLVVVDAHEELELLGIGVEALGDGIGQLLVVVAIGELQRKVRLVGVALVAEDDLDAVDQIHEVVLHGGQVQLVVDVLPLKDKDVALQMILRYVQHALDRLAEIGDLKRGQVSSFI